MAEHSKMSLYMSFANQGGYKRKYYSHEINTLKQMR